MRSFLVKYRTTERVLEIGGGRVKGNHSYDDLFPNRHAYDIDPERLPDTVGDAHILPFGNSSFSSILCTEVLEHLHTPHQAISEMYRVLQPGGILILTTRFVFPLHDVPNDFYRYTKYGLSYLFKDWMIIEMIPETETFSGIAALVQRVGFQTRVRGGRVTKILIYALAWALDHLNWIIIEEFGDIKKKNKDETIITSGYYCVFRKEIS